MKGSLKRRLKNTARRAGNHVKNEVKDGVSRVGNAVKFSLSHVISDAVAELGLEAIKALCKKFIIKPIIRKIHRICKEYGWNTREVLADI